jgi:hypothetical protein
MQTHEDVRDIPLQLFVKIEQAGQGPSPVAIDVIKRSALRADDISAKERG